MRNNVIVTVEPLLTATSYNSLNFSSQLTFHTFTLIETSLQWSPHLSKMHPQPSQ